MPITSYSIYFRKSDLTYALSTSSCDGTLPAIRTALNCTVPLSSLTSSPFNLGLGASVTVQIVATNYYGDSATSDPGSGALI